jgi:hypothetical protein
MGSFMKSEIHFSAPWSLAVRIITLIVLALLLGVSLTGLTAMPAGVPFAAKVMMVVMPLAIVVGTLPFMVNGYVLREDELLIERLGWCNHVPLSTVVSATIDPDAIRGSIRLCGSGGLFGFFGWFRNRKLGVYRAYGTDPARSVVVKLSHRTLVITPDDPNRFVAELDSRRAARVASHSGSQT